MDRDEMAAWDQQSEWDKWPAPLSEGEAVRLKNVFCPIMGEL